MADMPQLSRPVASPLHQPQLHESGYRHVTGEALYVDDLPAPRGMLVGWCVVSPHAHAKLTRFDAARARAVPGVHAVLSAKDVPGHNAWGPVFHDDRLFAEGEVLYVGQVVALVVGESYEACRAGAALVEMDYEPLEATLTIDEAIEKDEWLSEPHVLQRGDVKQALAAAPHRFSAELRTGAQDHFYLETQVALATPGEGKTMHVASSTQHPSEVQAIVAEALGWSRRQVVVDCPRMGGGFGGKETQAAPFAAMAAIAAVKTGRPVKVWLNRDRDMETTGKRHPFFLRYEVGFDGEGHLLALDGQLVSDGGCTSDLSRAILDRALFHSDNSYFLPHVRLEGRVAKTNTPSNTAFRGFGGPQGMVLVEDALSRIAERLSLEPAEVRAKNFYGDAPRNLTPYHQEVKDNRLPRLWSELLASSDYAARRKELEAFNASHQWAKRGLAITPVKFGISFTTSFLNQAGALVLWYGDGTVQVNHGGTEMGQGLHTKMMAIAAHELGARLESIRVMHTATDKVPNTSATAASSGSDLNGQAVKQACETLRARVRPIAAKLLGLSEAEASGVVFEGGFAFDGREPSRAVALSEVTAAAVLAQVQLSATGYYRTPDITYDAKTGRGHPFHYFAYGAAVSEVEVSGLTGEHRLRRVDILHDVGDSLVPTVDRGQVEGGFIQGVGWLTCEEVLIDQKGVLKTHSPDTYKIPAAGDAPQDFRVKLLERAPQPEVIHGSKAVGEPPFMLALSVVAALRHAVSAFGPKGHEVRLALPATPEAILWAVEDARKAS